MEAEFRDACYSSFETFANAEGLPLSLPNIDFEPPKVGTDMYLAAYTLPVPSDTQTVCGGIARHQWISQLSVYSRDGVGERKALEIADKIKTAYPVTHEFVNGALRYRVTTPARPRPPIDMGDGWFSIPVRFRVSIFN